MPKTNPRKTLSRALLGGIAAFAMAGAAHATSITVQASDTAAPTLLVHYNDLNLNNAAGRDRLVKRINIASRRVCGVWSGSVLEHLPATRACYASARQNAQAQMDRLVAEARSNSAPVASS